MILQPTQFLFLPGRSGGQVANGGTAAGENLTLVSTAHATKGKILFGAAGNSVYDEVNDRLGIGIAAPTVELEVIGKAKCDTFQMTTGGASGNVFVSDASGNATWNTLVSAGIVGGSGSVDQVPRWVTSTTLGDSVMHQDGNRILLNTTTPESNMTEGLVLDQSANDNLIFACQSSDIALGSFGNFVDPSTYLGVLKASGLLGGANFQGFVEGNAGQCFRFECMRQAGGGSPLFLIDAYLSDGGTGRQAAGANTPAFVVRDGGTTDRFSIDSGGNVNIANLTASQLVGTDANKNLVSISDAGPFVKLNDIQNPDGNTLFNCGVNQVKLKWTSPVTADGAFELDVSGNFTGDVLHIHQHTGNPGASDLVHLEAEDTDVTILRCSNAGGDVVVLLNNGNLGIGTNTIPHGGVGAAKVAIEGTNASTSGPHMQFTTDSDNYPLVQLLAWTHDDITISFDAYFDGANAKSSDVGSNYRIHKQNDLFMIKYDSGIALGANLTWNIGTTLNTSGQFGIGVTPAQKFEIGSTDNSDRISIYHDNTDGWFRWDDGEINFKTNETGNVHGILSLRGNGTGIGILKIFDEDDAEELAFACTGGQGQININGPGAGSLALQTVGNGNVTCFEDSPSGTTRSFEIYSFRAADALRALTINVGVAAADTADFTGLSFYRINGSLGVGVIPVQKLEIGSNDGTNRISIYHDNLNGFIKWDDGDLFLQTDEGVNTLSKVIIEGKGTGNAQLHVISDDTSDVVLDNGTVTWTMRTNGFDQFAIAGSAVGNVFEIKSGANADSLIIGNDGNIGIGGTPNANAVLLLTLPTENLEFIDAGSVGATQQDWVEVEANGVQGYLHVFAAK